MPQQPDRLLAESYNPFAEEWRAYASAQYRSLRDHAPVHKFDGFKYPLYALTRHEDIKAMLRDPDLWSSRYGQAPMYIEEKGMVCDPPQHTAKRRMLNPVFTTRRVDAMRDGIGRLVDRLIDAIVERGGCDLYRDFAAIFPMSVAADLLGVEAARHADFRRWTGEFITAQLTSNREQEQAVRRKFAAYFEPLLDARRELLATSPQQAPDDAINNLVTARHDDGSPFDNEEIFPLLNSVVTGASDTTALLLANCVYRLLEDRRRWEQLCADPGLAEAAIEEALRFDPPVMGVFRTNKREVVLHGQTIPANSKVQAFIAAGNRDERVWEHPDEFRLDRDVSEMKQKQLGFGHGNRFCIGAHLVRLDTAIALRRLAERLPALRLAGEPGHFVVMQMQGINALPVAWDGQAG